MAEAEALAAEVEARFAFGENWRAFLQRVDPGRIDQAEASIRALIGCERLDGIRFIDIGSGSGLFSLAARRLGAEVFSFDFDPRSVECARILRDRFCPNDPSWTIAQGSVLDAKFMSSLGQFDIAYSWGVLHHTGAMHRAVANAASLAGPGGLFVFALYRRTLLCPMWTEIKRWYAKADKRQQGIARKIFTLLLHLKFALSGKRFSDYIESYRSMRGMDFPSDVHDWIGGFPYESISPDETERVMRHLGFEAIRRFVGPHAIGFFGSGCDEYVYRRADNAEVGSALRGVLK